MLVTTCKQAETNNNTVTGTQASGHEWRGIPPLLYGLDFNLAVWFHKPHSFHNPNVQELGEEFCVVLCSLWFLIFLFEFQGSKRSLLTQKKRKLIWYVQCVSVKCNLCYIMLTFISIFLIWISTTPCARQYLKYCIYVLTLKMCLFHIHFHLQQRFCRINKSQSKWSFGKAWVAVQALSKKFRGWIWDWNI